MSGYGSNQCTDNVLERKENLSLLNISMVIAMSSKETQKFAGGQRRRAQGGVACNSRDQERSMSKAMACYTAQSYSRLQCSTCSAIIGVMHDSPVPSFCLFKMSPSESVRGEWAQHWMVGKGLSIIGR